MGEDNLSRVSPFPVLELQAHFLVLYRISELKGIIECSTDESELNERVAPGRVNLGVQWGVKLWMLNVRHCWMSCPC